MGRRDRDGAMQEATRHVESLDNLGEWEVKDLVDRAQDIGNELSRRKMTTSQIRNFLDQVNRIWAENRAGSFDDSEVILLKPQLAYSAGRETDRNKQEVLKSFATLFSAAADRVRSREDFEKFKDLTQAVVAYHRFYGGSNQ